MYIVRRKKILYCVMRIYTHTETHSYNIIGGKVKIITVIRFPHCIWSDKILILNRLCLILRATSKKVTKKDIVNITVGKMEY